MLSLILAAALTGQNYRQCQTAASYGGYRQTFAAPVYPTYAAPSTYVATSYATKLVTAFIPVAQVDPYRIEIVGDQYRSAAYAQQRLQTDTSLINAINGFSSGLEKFRLQVAAATQPAAAPPQAESPAPNIPSTPAPAPTNVSPPIPNPSVAPGPLPFVDSGSASPLKAAVTTVLSSRCGKCHTGGASSGGFKIFDSKDQLANLSPLGLLKLDVVGYSGEFAGKKMPPSGKALTSDEYSTIRAYLNSRQSEITAMIEAGEGGFR